MSSGSPTSLSHDFDRLDVVALTTIEGFGPATARAHLARIRDDQRTIDDGFPPGVMPRARRVALGHLDRAREIGARCIVDGETDYPESLHSLEHPPVAVWVMGDLAPVRDRLAVSIVGTRDCTEYGERITRQLSGAFARAGVTVVSGMALGIDAAAHRAAMESSGPTVAVLGTGVDLPYPASHRSLHAKIRERGLVLSEAPPGTRAQKGCFPRRNRIIAALGVATIVVEAGVKSGALNTAEHAVALDRKLAAVPGPIDSPTSLGSNLLLRDGAYPITSIADALALLGRSEVAPLAGAPETGDERRVWVALERPAADFDVLCARTDLPARICFETVTALEIRGLVECSLTGELRRR